MKKTKLYVGICLAIQSLSFFILFLIFLSKKKSYAAAIGALSAAGGIAGGILLFQAYKEDKEHKAKLLAEESNTEDDEFDNPFAEDDIFCDFENELDDENTEKAETETNAGEDEIG